MGNLQIPTDMHLVMGLAPVADAFSGTVYSDIIEVAGQGMGFVIFKGAGATGTSTVTVEACSTITAAATTAVAFWYKRIGATDSGWTAATSAGFTTTAAASDIYHIAVAADVIGVTGYAYARLKMVESVNDPVLGGILAYVYGGRFTPQPASLID